jgi:hypothetical protein
MSSKNQYSRLGCGKQESPNHSKSEMFQQRQKGLNTKQPLQTLVDENFLNNQAI